MLPNKMIGISGGSCSGKTTLEHNLQARLGNRLAVLSFDDMSWGRAELVRRNTTDWEDPAVYRWDAYEEHLRALKSGKPANIIAHSRESRESGITHKRIAPREFVVSAGVLALHYAHIRNLFTTTIYLDIDEQELTRRRLARGEHDIGPWNELPYIEGNLLPKHRALVVPQKAHAQYVLDATLPPDEVARQVIDILTAPA